MEPQAEEITLEFAQIGVSKMVSSSFKREMKVHVWEELGGTLGAALSAYILQNTIHREVQETYEYPKNLWNHLLSILPYVKRWAKTNRVEKTVHYIHMCPHLEWPDRDSPKYHIQFMKSPHAS